MAGRPRRKLERLKQLVATAEKLEWAIIEATPPRRIDKAHPTDPTWEKWDKAQGGALSCFEALDGLADELEERLERQAANNPLIALVDEDLDADEAQAAVAEGKGESETPDEAGHRPGDKAGSATAGVTDLRVRPRAQGKEVPTDG